MQGAKRDEETWKTLFQRYDLDRLGTVGQEAQTLISLFSEPFSSGGETSATTLLMRKIETFKVNSSSISSRQRQVVLELLKALQVEEKTLGLLKREEIIYRTIISSGIIERLGEMHCQLLEAEIAEVRRANIQHIQNEKNKVIQSVAQQFGVSSLQITVEDGEEIQEGSPDLEIILEI